ncbi:MAG TPA: hypothetical protein VIT89_01290 [Solirubrobacterales bacterium]
MRFLASVLLASLAFIATGCGSGEEEETTPVACLEGPAAYRLALETNPRVAYLENSTLISECLPPNQSAGDLARVGEAMVKVATGLNAEARARGIEGPRQLGFLVGAAERGAEEGEGIHTDLIRRLTAAAKYAPGNQSLPEVSVERYEKGFEAGHSRG